MPAYFRMLFPPGVTVAEVTAGVCIGIALYVAVALLCGSFMVRKGRSRALGVCLVIFLGFIGMLIVLVYPGADTSHRLRRREPASYEAKLRPGMQMQQDGTSTRETVMQVCPFCNSRVPTDASYCRVCHETLTTLPGAPA